MKKLMLWLLSSCLSCVQGFAQTYEKENVALLTYWDDPALTETGWAGNRYNSCWGYTTATGREIAIVGAASGTYFIDITNDGIPVQLDFVAGRRGSCTWREYKTYQNYLYVVSDDVGSSLQIMDLSYLPDSVHVAYDGTDIVSEVHTLFVDGSKLYFGIPKGPSVGGYSSMAVYELADNPLAPAKITDLSGIPISQVHDMFARNDTVYASCGNEGLYVFVLEGNQLVQKGALNMYAYSGYNHSSVLSPDGSTLYMTDEVPGQLPCKIVDVRDLTSIEVRDTFTSGGSATPHNPFLAGNNHMVMAYYEDGLQIYDITDPVNIVKTGFFDTHHQTPINAAPGGYAGLWSAYTELPSRRIIAVDMQNGLFVLDATEAGIPTVTNTPTPTVPTFPMTVAPNPFAEHLQVRFETALPSAQLTLQDIGGKTYFVHTLANTHQYTLPTQVVASLPNGVYTLTVRTQEGVSQQKVVKIK